MPRTPVFTEADAERVERFLKKGYSYRRIAQEFACDYGTVRNFVAEYLPDWFARRAGQHTPSPGMRLLTIDIETRPNLAYIWDVWSRQPVPYERLINEKEMISFAAKWVGSDKVEFRSAFHDGKSEMISRAHALLDEASGVITYNGQKFDLPHINLEFLRNGLKPPAPYKSIDLYLTIRRKFNFTSNKLGHVAEKLGLGSKVEHEGFSLWEKCMAGDKDAWARMREYNIQDVRLTEELYHKILPWIEGHPSHAALSSDTVCPNCGSDNLKPQGWYYTKTGAYHRYQCGDCGKWTRDTKRTFHTDITETALS